MIPVPESHLLVLLSLARKVGAERILRPEEYEAILAATHAIHREHGIPVPGMFPLAR